MTSIIDLTLEPQPDAPARARRALLALREMVDEGVWGDVQLLVSELVTNSLLHAGLADEDRIELAVRVNDRRVRVEVADPGGAFALSPDREDEDDGIGGWGLYLVEQLADRWGLDRGGATRMWFELDRGPARAAA